MALILNIDTSSQICSVALAKDGETVVGLESADKMDHARTLAPFVDQCLDYVRQQKEKLDAIAVAYGPGSYTGLRIGLSLAKGLCFGFDIPLITISSLKVMAVRAIFSDPNFEGDETIAAMIDARRMEVYAGIFNSALNLILPEKAVILDENSFKDLEEKRKVIFIGDGVEKFRPLYKGKNAEWIPDAMAHAKYMTTLSELMYRNKEFSDVAYTVPNYLKEYQTTTPKARI